MVWFMPAEMKKVCASKSRNEISDIEKSTALIISRADMHKSINVLCKGFIRYLARYLIISRADIILLALVK